MVNTTSPRQVVADEAEIDDVFHHRLGLACLALGDVPLRVRDQLSHWVDRLTETMYRVCCDFFVSAEGGECRSWDFVAGQLDYFQPAIQAIGNLNGRVRRFVVGADHIFARELRLTEYLMRRLEKVTEGVDINDGSIGWLASRFSDAARWVQLAVPAAKYDEIVEALLLCLEGDPSIHNLECVTLASGKLARAASHEVMRLFVGAVAEIESGLDDYGSRPTGVWYVRKAAITALGDLGSITSSNTVLSVLSEILMDSSCDIPNTVAKALRELGNSAVTNEMLSSLIRALNNGSPSAAEALAEFGDAAATNEVVHALWEAIDRGDTILAGPGTRGIMLSAAVKALCKVEEGISIAPVAKRVLEFVGGTSLESPNECLRVSRALADLGRTGNTDAMVCMLVEALSDTRRWVRAVGALALSELGDLAATEAAVRALLRIIENDKESEVRVCAIIAMTKLRISGTEEMTNSMVQALKSLWSSGLPNHVVVIRWLTNLGEFLENSAAINELIDFLLGIFRGCLSLERNREFDRICVADLLGKLGRTAATGIVVATLLAAVERADDRSVRMHSLDALGRMGVAAGSEEVVRILLCVLRDDSVDDTLQFHAAFVLEKLGPAAVTGDVASVLLEAFRRNWQPSRSLIRVVTIHSLCTMQSHPPGYRIFRRAGFFPSESKASSYLLNDTLSLAALPAADPVTRVIGGRH